MGIIADRTLKLAVGLGAVAAVAGAAVALYYAAHGLSLSHYDAKAHLVVARRILDSLTPGWRQIGAVWLPLPHVLNMVPVQVDAFYRTGASGTALSVVSYGVAVGALAWTAGAATGSRWAAVATTAVLLGDPNLLYLQATPMTEPLLVGLMAAGLALTYRWVDADGQDSPLPAGLFLAGACLTRYEAWPYTAAVVGLAAVALWMSGHTMRGAVARAARLGLGPAVAILGFFVLSRATVGEWFVVGGFFVPDNKALGKPLVAAISVWWGTRRLIGTATVIVGVVGLAVLAWRALAHPRRFAPALLVAALFAPAALPWYAFVSGHPFRIRYMVVLVAGVAAASGILVGLLPRRLRPVAAVAIAVLAFAETPPLSPRAPMVVEAQWDTPNSRARRAVTACLAAEFRRPDEKILASMGSLAHYMQELSQEGFVLSDFVHEGIGQLWGEAVASPRRHVEWVLFEERAEGGDMLTALRRTSPAFVDGFRRVCEGGGVALYRREPVRTARGT